MIRKLFLTICALLIAFYGSNAQSSWQWGKRGGSSTASLSGGHDEEVTDMATDTHGNIYVLSDVWTPGLDIDGHAKGGYGSRDMLLSSFKCDGTYRWSKIIGGNQPDLSVAVKTDSLGGVYITGHLAASASSLYIDTDSSWVGGSQKSLFIAKFDTGGTYKWFRMPQADTVTAITYGNSGFYDMDVDGAGNLYMFCCLAPGAYAGGAYVVTTNKAHVLKYNKDGIFQSGLQLPISFTLPSPRFKMKRDHGNGRFYVTGDLNLSGSVLFGTTPITHTLFIGCFNSAGTLLWQKQNTSTSADGPFGRAAISPQHNIYLCGTSNYMTINDTFNTYVVNNTVRTYGAVPLVVAMDSNGNHLWGSNGSANAATRGGYIILNGNEVDIAGSYPGKLKWGTSDSLMQTGGCLYTPFIARFNVNTGALLKLDAIANVCGSPAFPTGITADKSGNFYIGGYFTDGITVSGTSLSSAGGGSDFFVAKYGTTNCGCTLPAAGFTATGTRTVTFTYTGTTGYDSVRWNFGDGGTSTLASPTHYYSTVGAYTACVTVYNSCGSNVYCQTVTITNGVSTLSGALNNVAVYPNPMNEQLILENVQTGTAIRLYNMMGQQVYGGIADDKKQTISTQKLPPGSYVIQLIDNSGNTMSKTIVKQ